MTAKKTSGLGKRTFLFYTAVYTAGMLLGINHALQRQARRRHFRRRGFVSVPNTRLDRLTAPFPPDDKTWLDCTQLPPRECADNEECQSRCGTHFSCRTLDHDDVIVNNVRLKKGGRYCLADSMGACSCRAGVSRIYVSYDPFLREPLYKCLCQFPDVFAGEQCADYIACRDPRDPTRVAPLWDRVLERELDPRDGEAFADGTINLYETTADGRPRYYCKCKELDARLVSFPHPFRCAPDPCLANAEPGKLHASVTGQPDGTFLEQMSCECGDAAVTRLFGTDDRRTPCSAIRTPDCVSWRRNQPGWGDNGALRCACRDDAQTFIPCNNNFRRVAGLDECRSFGAYMLDPDNDPAAGVCVDACKYCAFVAGQRRMPLARPNDPFGLPERYQNACQDDPRTDSTCLVDRTLVGPPFDSGLRRRPTFACRCAVDEAATFWQVHAGNDGTTQQCVGSKPPCKGYLAGCDEKTDTDAVYGPVCCDDRFECANVVWSLCHLKYSPTPPFPPRL